MSDSDSAPKTPKPSIPKPSLPKPSLPTPSVAKTPTPSLTPREAAPPISRVDSGAMEKPSVEKVAAETAQEVADVEETILHKRLLAGVIDAILAGALWGTLQAILPGTALDKLAAGVACAYLLLKDALPFLNGQSVGKKAMGLRAFSSTGKPLTNDYKASAIRNVLLIIPVMPLVELILLFKREDDAKQGLRLGDEFAHTMVKAEAAATTAVGEEEI